ncbi:MAG: T9SS type A sorting domain-containing protein, partial [Ignavibacteria bacterium]
NTSYRHFDIKSANGNWDWAKCSGGEYKFTNYSNTFNFFYHGLPNRYFGESTFNLRDKFVLDVSCQPYSFAKSFYMGVNGDSNTCFDVDYNQVYSPWSNPPLPVSNSNDSLTIEITGRNSSGDMIVALYYTNITGASPSKPQSLAASKNYIDQPPSIFHPKLVWNRNLEPDLQKYKIYRGVGDEPSSYSYLAETTDTTYLDESITLRKSGGGSGSCAYVLATYAYKVSAVDLSSKESVKSLKSNISGYSSPCEEEGAMPYAKNNSKYNFEYSLSKDINQFKLYDNYPNPFNPETKISFDIPESRYVTLKIYNLLGKEILVLVNEFLNKGGYSVIVNAANLPSGIYYYKLEAGNYVSVKKMIVIK